MFLGWWTTKFALNTKVGKLNKKQNTSYLTCCLEIISQILSQMCQIIKEMVELFPGADLEMDGVWSFIVGGGPQLRPWSSPTSVCISIRLNLVWGFHRELLLPLPSERPPSVAAFVVDPPYKANPHSLPHKLPVCIAGGDRWAMTHSSRPLHFSHAARFCSPRQLEQPMAGERWGVRSR